MYNETIKRELFEFANTLASKQKVSGAWCSNKPNLESVVITCQSLLFLSELNKSLFKKNIQRTITWLLKPNISSHEYSYWSALPLIISDASKDVVKTALQHVKAKVEKGILHHENSPLEPYYTECTYLANCDDALSNKLVEGFISEIEDPKPEWSPERLSYRYQNIALRKKEEAVHLLRGLTKEIETRCSSEGDILFFSSLISTCYVMINFSNLLISDCDKKIKQVIKPYFDGLLKHIEKHWYERKLTSPPLAGGDIQNPLYFKIVVARALNKAYFSLEPNWQTKIIARKYRLSKNFILFFTYIIIGIFLLFGVKLILPHLQNISPNLNQKMWLKIEKGSVTLAYITFFGSIIHLLIKIILRKNK